MRAGTSGVSESKRPIVAAKYLNAAHSPSSNSARADLVRVRLGVGVRVEARLGG